MRTIASSFSELQGECKFTPRLVEITPVSSEEAELVVDKALRCAPVRKPSRQP